MYMSTTVKVNGFVCKDPMVVNADDFFKAAELDKPRDTMASKVGSNVTLINVMKIPGLNTLGISLARIDYAPSGENPPHTHPRATEILTVLEGKLYVGFVTSNPNQLFTKELNEGDVFVFPEGLIHFQFNPLTITRQQLRSPLSAAKIQGLLPSPMQSSDQNHRSPMMSWPRHSRWKRGLLIGFKPNSGRTTITDSRINNLY